MILEVKLDYTKCKNEQQFKKLYIKEWSKGYYKYFCIETEETNTAIETLSTPVCRVQPMTPRI